MKMGEVTNAIENKAWYQNFWVIFGLFLVLLLILGLGLFVYRTYSFYQDIKSGQVEQNEFMPISEPTAEMKMREMMVEKQREATRQIVKGDDGDPFYGPQNAEQQIVVFLDFGCPYCKMAVQTIENLKRLAPDAKIVFRDFPITELHPNSMLAARAARCVWRQGDKDKYFRFTNILYTRQDNHSESDLKKYAVEVGAESLGYELCMKQQSVVSQINQSIMDAERAGVTATPTFFIDGYKVEGVHDASKLVELLK